MRTRVCWLMCATDSFLCSIECLETWFLPDLLVWCDRCIVWAENQCRCSWHAQRNLIIVYDSIVIGWDYSLQCWIWKLVLHKNGKCAAQSNDISVILSSGFHRYRFSSLILFSDLFLLDALGILASDFQSAVIAYPSECANPHDLHRSSTKLNSSSCPSTVLISRSRLS